MRKIAFLSPLVFLSFILACNSNPNKSANGASDSTTQIMDSSHHNMNMSSNQTLPQIPSEARVYFKNLKEGQTVSSPLKVEMGAEGMNVDTAGTVKAGSGHH